MSRFFSNVQRLNDDETNTTSEKGGESPLPGGRMSPPILRCHTQFPRCVTRVFNHVAMSPRNPRLPPCDVPCHSTCCACSCLGARLHRPCHGAASNAAESGCRWLTESMFANLKRVLLPAAAHCCNSADHALWSVEQAQVSHCAAALLASCTPARPGASLSALLPGAHRRAAAPDPSSAAGCRAPEGRQAAAP
jgi:hypothetical protein